MISIYTKEEIQTLRISGRMLAEALGQVAGAVKPGTSTKELDLLAETVLREKGATPAFLHYKAGNGPAYPASLCTSINEEIVHCIPNKKRNLKEGDIISLDLGANYKGLITDMAVTVAVGKVEKKVKKLLTATLKCLELGIAEVKAGATTGDIGKAIENCAQEFGFGLVRDLVGHGVGHHVHEEPQVPNYGTRGQGVTLKSGMVIAIEPMLTLGRGDIQTLADGWGISTVDGSLSAHFERTVLVTENGSEILTKLTEKQT